MNGDEAIIRFAVTAMPVSVFSRYGVSQDNIQGLIHELLCLAIHHGNSDALNALTNYVEDISSYPVEEI